MFGKAVCVVIIAVALTYIGCPWLDVFLKQNDISFDKIHARFQFYLNRLGFDIVADNDPSKIKNDPKTGEKSTLDENVDVYQIIDSWEGVIETPYHCLNKASVKDEVARSGSSGTPKLFKTIAVGMNANIDLIISGTKLLEALNVKPGDFKNHPVVHSLHELQEGFHYNLRRSSAAERPFSNQKLYKEIISRALKGVKGADTGTYIGGNAALMAWNLVNLYPDVNVTLVGPIGPKLLELLVPKVNVPEFSQLDEDEVHLIMEYQKEEVWGTTAARVANRFITSYDQSNSNLVMMDLFFNVIEEQKVDLVLLSGLHMLDSQPTSQWTVRLNTLATRLHNVPEWRPVHLELASMTNGELVKYMTKNILTKVASLGLNEQELLLIARMNNGPHSKLHLPTGLLDIEKIGDSLHWLLASYGFNSTHNAQSKLTRIHFHALAFHITATVGDVWKNQFSATGAGARIAGLKACSVSKLDASLVHLKIPHTFSIHNEAKTQKFDSKNPITTWKSRKEITLIFCPVLICNSPVKTVGLGDAISSTGLVYSAYGK